MDRFSLPADALPPADGEVLLLLARSERVDPEIALACLDATERERRTRLQRERDQQDFLAAHAWLRHLLGACVGVPPAAVQIALESSGKPCLPASPDLHFNLSHSAGLVAIALGRAARVGVDVEAVTPDAAVVDDVAGQLAFEERHALTVCAPEQRNRLFFTLWTLKEAYAKARGDGLALALDSYAFTLDGERIAFRSDHGDAQAWQFHGGLVAGCWRWSLAVAMPPSCPLRLRLFVVD